MYKAITNAFDKTVPAGWENFAGTKRKYSLTHYATYFENPAVTGNTNTFYVPLEGLMKYVNDTENPPVYGYHPDMMMGSEEYFEEVWKKTGWGHQTMGGANGGKPEDKWSVTDSHGRIYNMKGVRVVDASFAPTIPQGNPWLSISGWAAVLAYKANKDWNTGYENLNIMPLEKDHPYYVDSPGINADKLSATYPIFSKFAH